MIISKRVLQTTYGPFQINFIRLFTKNCTKSLLKLKKKKCLVVLKVAFWIKCLHKFVYSCFKLF